jgi:hypothetical protein
LRGCMCDCCLTDHRPMVTTVRAGSHMPGAEKLVSLKRQNFKAVTRPELEGALNLTDWSKVYNLKDVDAVLKLVTAGISPWPPSSCHQPCRP